MLLTGKVPRSGADAANTGSALKHESLTLPRDVQPQIPPPRNVQCEVPLPLDAVCLRAMAHEPGNRYPTALELAHDVEHWLADEPVAAYRDRRRDRILRWGRRHRTLVTALGVVLLMAALGPFIIAGFTARAWVREAAQKVRAEEARRVAEGQANREQRARLEAEIARQAALRNALSGCHSAADACLAEARALWYVSSQPGRQDQALAQIGRGAGFERQGRATLAELGNAAGALAGVEPAAWNKTRDDLRSEAGRWLTQLVLGRTRTIPLPFPPPNHEAALNRSWREVPQRFQGYQSWLGWTGDIAVSPDGSRIAVAYAGAAELLVLTPQDQATRRWPLPKQFPFVRLGMYCESLKFVTQDRIEMRTRQEVVGWNWPQGKADFHGLSPREADEAQRRIVVREEARRTAWAQQWAGGRRGGGRGGRHAGNSLAGGPVRDLQVSDLRSAERRRLPNGASLQRRSDAAAFRPIERRSAIPACALRAGPDHRGPGSRTVHHGVGRSTAGSRIDLGPVVFSRRSRHAGTGQSIPGRPATVVLERHGEPGLDALVAARSSGDVSGRRQRRCASFREDWTMFSASGTAPPAGKRVFPPNNNLRFWIITRTGISPRPTPGLVWWWKGGNCRCWSRASRPRRSALPRRRHRRAKRCRAGRATSSNCANPGTDISCMRFPVPAWAAFLR